MASMGPGKSKVVEYFAVPEKLSAAGSARVVHDTGDASSTALGRTGPPAVNSSFHGPSSGIVFGAALASDHGVPETFLWVKVRMTIDCNGASRRGIALWVTTPAFSGCHGLRTSALSKSAASVRSPSKSLPLRLTMK